MPGRPPALQLVSIIAYHVAPMGALDPKALLKVQDIPTALSGSSLLVSGGGELLRAS